MVKTRLIWMSKVDDRSRYMSWRSAGTMSCGVHDIGDRYMRVSGAMYNSRAYRVSYSAYRVGESRVSANYRMRGRYEDD